MNSVSSRLKAIAVTFLFFALSAFLLLGVIWGLDRLPLPGADIVAGYRPGDTVAAVSDLRLPVALTSGFLVASAVVLLFSSAYLDRMIAIFADVLLMLMAAMAGFVGGYWVMLRLAGSDMSFGWDFAQSALVAPVVVFAVSLLAPQRMRSTWLLRIVLVLLLLAGAVALIRLVP